MTTEPQSLADHVRTFWVPATLLVFAGVLGVGSLVSSSPAPKPTPTAVPGWATDPTPVRRPKLKPTYTVGAFTYRCSECHHILPSPSETERTLTQHREVRLEHGINTRCFNCHHRANRDAFADDYDREIPWDQPQLLCAKCHGTVYRDWQHGAHGRTTGTWEAKRGTQGRLRCIECHDPHAPPFHTLAPAPGPNTLRMGRQDFGRHDEGHDPLRLGTHQPATNVGPAPVEKD